MALVIRLAPFGRKHRHTYRIRVAERQSPLTGRFVAELGSWDPHAFRGQGQVRLDVLKCQKFIENGAKPSETVAMLLRSAGFNIERFGSTRASRGTRKNPIILLLQVENDANILPDLVGYLGARHKGQGSRVFGVQKRRMDVSLASLFNDPKRPAWDAALRLPGWEQAPVLDSGSSLERAGLGLKPVAQIVVKPVAGKEDVSPLRLYIDVSKTGTRYISFNWPAEKTMLTATRAVARYIEQLNKNKNVEFTLESDSEEAVDLKWHWLDSMDPLYKALSVLGSISRAHFFSSQAEATINISASGLHPLSISVSMPVDIYLNNKESRPSLVSLLRHTSATKGDDFHLLSNSIEILHENLALEDAFAFPNKASGKKRA